jgi:serine protease AprX
MATRRKKRPTVRREKPPTPPRAASAEETEERPERCAYTRDFFEHFLLGGGAGGQRFTQDGPILPEVWLSFATTLTERVPILITPFHEVMAGRVVRDLLAPYESDSKALQKAGRGPSNSPISIGREARVAYLDQVVAANLSLLELVSVVTPLTDWWASNVTRASSRGHFEYDRRFLLRCAIAELIDDPARPRPRVDIADSIARFVVLVGLLLVRGEFGVVAQSGSAEPRDAIEDLINSASGRKRLIDRMVEKLESKLFCWDALSGLREQAENPGSAGVTTSIYSVSLNRTAFPAVYRSVQAIKADAAHMLFKTDCRRLTWAIIDSGIDARHPTFWEVGSQGETTGVGVSRVREIYDFTCVRNLLWFDRLTSDAERDELINEMQALSRIANRSRVEELVTQIAQDVAAMRKVNWPAVAQLLRRESDTPPYTDHGTHVASILAGAGWKGHENLRGVCPDLNLVDLRVLGKSLEETEFAVIAALQFVRQRNERGIKTIHGANLSLSIPHDVRNYACGRTPVCEEAERLTASTVTVVAAAGNFGYQEYQTSKGLFPGYCAISITDPGNAQSVITVGSTHRFRPHTYGVSYFSSRGPTGDGRVKPDIVAPGEKIEAALPNSDYGSKDGTSMAAPHVSGAAAMIMARYAELVDDPMTIKKLLMESATDLGREKYFQGEGMLDVLRAMQKV